MFVTATEWKEQYGGHKQITNSAYGALPYNCCALSLREFETPYCTREGFIFELTNIVPYIKKHGLNPVNGNPLSLKELFPLHFHRNGDGEFQCPVMFKVFNQHTHIVAIATSGNVYCRDAVDQMNLKAKNMTDLMSGEAFKKSDIITIQDPLADAKRKISDFHCVKAGHKTQKPAGDAASNMRVNDATARVLHSLAPTKGAPGAADTESSRAAGAASSSDTPVQSSVSVPARPVQPVKKVGTGKVAWDAPGYGKGLGAASLTSTNFAVVTANALEAKKEEDLREPVYAVLRKKKLKSYLALSTSLGDLNIELHSDMAPKTCDSFVGHCTAGYYDNLLFHRVVANFMIQGGDPTGSGKGGASVWGGKFKDEFHPKLKHDRAGVLSMANSGPNTNGSQFFITFNQCEHLDGKHSVFGRVVGNLAVLNSLHNIETDGKDRPQQPVTILKTTVFVNAFDEAQKVIDDAEEKKASELGREKQMQAAMMKRALGEEVHNDWEGPDVPQLAETGASVSGVGKYLPVSAMANAQTSSGAPAASSAPPPQKKMKTSSFGNFDHF